MMPKRLPKSVYNFIGRIAELTTIERALILPSGRKENDAEHSWHLAVMVWLFAPYYEQKVNVERAVKMALMHDLVELIAGDVPAWLDRAGKKEREDQAAKELFSPLPHELRDELHSLWEEFEADATPEAQFVNSLDDVHPLLLYVLNKGKGNEEYEVTEEKVRQWKARALGRGGIAGKIIEDLISEARKGDMFWKAGEKAK